MVEMMDAEGCQWSIKRSLGAQNHNKSLLKLMASLILRTPLLLKKKDTLLVGSLIKILKN